MSSTELILVMFYPQWKIFFPRISKREAHLEDEQEQEVSVGYFLELLEQVDR